MQALSSILARQAFNVNCQFNSNVIKFNKYFTLLSWYQTSYIHTTLNCKKGHSKWANIKHTKQAKDLEKSQTFMKYARLIRLAAKESGGTDPVVNSKLARVIEQAKNQQMPSSTIEQNLKSIEKADENAKPAIISMIGSGGIFLLVDVLTDKVTRTRQQLAAIIKKANLKCEKSDRVEAAFDEKGVIVAKGEEADFSTALEHAIEVGAEDVVFEDGFFTFTSSPNDFIKVKKGLEDLKYDLQYADIDRIPSLFAVVKDSDMDNLKLVISRLEQHEDVIRVHTNFDL